MKFAAVAAIATLLGACQSGPVLDTSAVDVPAGTPELFSSLADLGAGPYTVGANKDVAPETVAVVQAAIEHVNGMAGFEVLRWHPVNMLAQAHVTTVVPSKASTMAYAWRSPDTGECRLEMGRPASMAFQGSPVGTIDVPLAAHELVHCLGIDHDASPDSLMHRYRLRERDQPLTAATVELLHRMAGHE